MKNSYWIAILALGLVGLLVFGYGWQNKGTDANQLPKYAMRTASVQAAYRYALDNPELLDYIPCYCDCSSLGHEDVGDCFIKGLKDNGEVVFDEHGSNCGICYSTVLESKELLKQGKSVKEIREYIDNKYSEYGQGTDTPLP
ncbi:MAG: PCYCGC motif-containing (lipo)protein [Candidatus Portnoybacteria bacterium]